MNRLKILYRFRNGLKSDYETIFQDKNNIRLINDKDR